MLAFQAVNSLSLCVQVLVHVICILICLLVILRHGECKYVHVSHDTSMRIHCAFNDRISCYHIYVYNKCCSKIQCICNRVFTEKSYETGQILGQTMHDHQSCFYNGRLALGIICILIAYVFTLDLKINIPLADIFSFLEKLQ